LSSNRMIPQKLCVETPTKMRWLKGKNNIS